MADRFREQCVELYFSCMGSLNLRVHSRGYHCPICVPRQRCARVPHRVLRLSRLPLHVSSSQHYLLRYVRDGEPEQGQGVPVEGTCDRDS